MARTDYHHDPDAPAPNSLVPSTTAAVRDEAGRLLLIHAYDDGEVRQAFSVCFHARVLSGTPREDGSETKEVRWVEPADILDLSIHPSMRRRIEDALADRSAPQIV
jgi:hypothetical protein